MSPGRVPSVELRFGERWTGDVEYLLRLADQADQPHPDLRCVRDVIDIVVGGDNLTAGLGEDGIFCVLADLIAGLDDLLAGRRDKVIIDFREAPWELAVVARGEHLALSLYSVLPGERVEVHDRLAPIRHVTDAVVAAADLLGAALDRIRPGLSSHPLMQVPQRVRACARAIEPEPDRSVARAGHCVVAPGLLGVTLDLSHRALWNYAGAEFDLHALLCDGAVRWLGPEPVAFEGTAPLQILRGLVADLRDVVEALGGGRPRPVRRQRRVLLLEGFRADAGDVALVPAGVFVRPGPCGPPDGSVVARARAVVSAVVEAVDAVVEALRTTNAELVKNERVAALVRDASGLGAWYEELADGDLRPASDDVEGDAVCLDVWGADAAESGLPARFTFAQLRALRLRRRWSIAGALRVAEARRIDDALLVPEEGGLACYDLASGEVIWRRASVADSSTLWVSGSAVFHASPGQLQAVDLSDGHGWATALAARGPCEGGARFAGGAVAIACAGGVACVDLVDGAARWLVPMRHGRAVGSGAEGRHFVVGSDRGFVYGVDVVRGETVWRSRVGAGAARPQLRPGAALLVAGSDPPQIARLQRATGALLWQVPLAEPSRAVEVVGELALVLTGSSLTAHRLVCGTALWTLEGVDRLVGETWVGAQRRWLALTGTGVMCFDPVSGDVYWSAIRPVQVAVPAGDGAVAVAGRDGACLLSAASGRVLHELEGLPPSPAWLHVGADNVILVGELDDDSDEGRVTCFEPGFFLALLR